ALPALILQDEHVTRQNARDLAGHLSRLLLFHTLADAEGVDQVRQGIKKGAVMIHHPCHGNDSEPEKSDANFMELSKHFTSSKQHADAPAQSGVFFVDDRRCAALFTLPALNLPRLDSRRFCRRSRLLRLRVD